MEIIEQKDKIIENLNKEINEFKQNQNQHKKNINSSSIDNDKHERNNSVISNLKVKKTKNPLAFSIDSFIKNDKNLNFSKNDKNESDFDIKTERTSVNNSLYKNFYGKEQKNEKKFKENKIFESFFRKGSSTMLTIKPNLSSLNCILHYLLIARSLLNSSKSKTKDKKIEKIEKILKSAVPLIKQTKTESNINSDFKEKFSILKDRTINAFNKYFNTAQTLKKNKN